MLVARISEDDPSKKSKHHQLRINTLNIVSILKRRDLLPMCLHSQTSKRGYICLKVLYSCISIKMEDFDQYSTVHPFKISGYYWVENIAQKYAY